LNNIRNRSITAWEARSVYSLSFSAATDNDPRSGKKLTPALESIRRRGWRGGPIAPHRAFARLHLGIGRVVETVLLASGCTAVWMFLLPTVGKVWEEIFAFWGVRIGLKTAVLMAPQGWGHFIHFSLPCFPIPAGSASGIAWWIAASLTAIAFLSSFFLSEEAMPWAYLLRAFSILQTTALVYFLIASARFPHDLQGYTVSMLVFSCILIGLVPIMYAFTFYLLNFSLKQKLFLTFATMIQLSLLVPHQYLLHVYLLHWSVLFMPVLYFMFGPFLDILAFIGFYSWGMSWSAPNQTEI
jgi:hypothetical protein